MTRNGGRRGVKQEAERQRSERSSGIYGFANETVGEQVAELDSSKCSIRNGRF